MTCNLKCDKMFSNMNEMFLKYMLKYRLQHQKISRSKLSKIHTFTFGTGHGYGGVWTMRNIVSTFHCMGHEISDCTHVT